MSAEIAAPPVVQEGADVQREIPSSIPPSEPESGGRASWDDAEDRLYDSDFGDAFLKKLVRSSPPVFLPAKGERLGGDDGQRFEILDSLGKGAMGAVFRARDAELQRTVALKFLLPYAGLRSEALIANLQREARAIAKLNHDNIVRIHDVAQWTCVPLDRQVPFLVMECLEGESLVTLLRRARRLELRRALEIMLGVAAGLAHAHASGVIHRDLKPSNVFVSRDGTAKLLDFGLAHLMDALDPSSPSLPTAGTPPYMAPEQHRGEPQDERTDLWSAGLLFFELLTGQVPFPTATPPELFERITSSEPLPSVRERRPEVPVEVARLVASLLAKEPARRLPTARELLDQLRDLQEHFAPRRDRPRPTSERRQLTLVCCRLAVLEGSLDALDPEEYGELEVAFQRACSKVLHDYGGTVTNCVGDELMACFGYPRAREESSKQAVRAALDLVAAVPRELAAVSRARLGVRAGLHTDLVSLTEVAAEAEGSAPSLQGEAPRIAVWLAEQAEPGAVVLSDTTHQLVHEVFRTRKDEERVFAGLAGATPIRAHRVMGERRAAWRFARSMASGALTPLVGREHALAWLMERWTEASSGQPLYALLRGDAGVGKSRLVQELHRHLPPDSDWIMCQCWPHFEHSAFQPVLELLRQYFGLEPANTPERNLALMAERMAPLGLPPFALATFASFLSLPAPADAPPFPESPEERKERMIELFLALFRGVGRTAPLVIGIEDLHWADPSTLQLLRRAVDTREPGPRILVLFTARPDFRPPWREEPWVRTLELERLSPELTQSLIRKVLRGRALSEAMVGQLAAKTDGIPLFVEELTRMVLARARDGEAPPESLPSTIPVTLQELLLARLDLLPREHKALAQLAAVTGRGFSLELLALCAEHGEATIQRELSALVDAGLVQRESSGGPGYQFRHALLQEAAYRSLRKSARQGMHAQVARVLSERFPESVESQPEVLAHHFTEAGQVEAAIPLWARAGELASWRSAYVEAVSHLTRALELLRGLPDSPARRREELSLLTSRGYFLVETQGYGSPTAEQDYARIRALLGELGPSVPQAELSWWGPFSFYFARAEFLLAHEVAAQLVRFGEQARDPHLLELGHRKRATVLFTWGEMDHALEQAERAIASAGQHAELQWDPARQQVLARKHWVESKVMALSYASVVHSAMGQPDRAWRRSSEAIKRAEGLNHTNSLLYALTYVALSCQLRHEAECVVVWADRAIALAREQHIRLWLGWATLIRSWAVAARGQPAEALEIMNAGLSRWKASGFRAGLPHNLGMKAEMHLMLGQAGEGLEAVGEAFRWVEATGERSYEVELHRLEGELRRARQEEGPAEKCFLQALEVARRQGARGFGLRAAVSLARQLGARDEPAKGRWLLERWCEEVPAGADSPDLREARALLERLRGERA